MRLVGVTPVKHPTPVWYTCYAGGGQGEGPEMEDIVQFSGGKWTVWKTVGFTYEGVGWYTPVRERVAEFETKEEAEAALRAGVTA